MNTRVRAVTGIAAAIVLCAIGSPAAGDHSGPVAPRCRRSVIPGTWYWDIESDRLGQKGSHLWWEHRDELRRRLTPLNGTGLARVTGRSFENLTLAALQRIDYSNEPIDGSDFANALEPGAVVALRTPACRFGKLRVVRYYALHDIHHPAAGVLPEDWKTFALTRPDIANYSIEVDWILYPAAP